MEYHYDPHFLTDFIEKTIVGLTPKNIPEDISELVPEKIWKTITSNVKKDIKEMYNVYFYEQWTATSLMAFRVLEEVLRVHVKIELNNTEIRNIGSAISSLKDNNYSDDLIKSLEILREQRNNFMHGKQRASIENTKSLVSYVMSITLQVYNLSH